jgi:hypothetical protein
VTVLLETPARQAAAALVDTSRLVAFAAYKQYKLHYVVDRLCRGGRNGQSFCQIADCCFSHQLFESCVDAYHMGCLSTAQCPNVAAATSLAAGVRTRKCGTRCTVQLVDVMMHSLADSYDCCWIVRRLCLDVLLFTLACFECCLVQSGLHDLAASCRAPARISVLYRSTACMCHTQ